jgi:peptidoglycan-N-acetylglucosamine deacetylase
MLKSSISRLLRKVLPQSILRRKVPNSQHSVFLTFDDGPHPEVTPKLLDLLDTHNVKATFFVIGINAQQYPELVSDIARRGHSVANHSYRHLNLPNLSPEVQLTEICQAKNIIESIVQKPCVLFRAPRGQWSVRVLLKLRHLKIKAVHWNRDSLDYQQASPVSIIQNFKDNPLVKGDIVLFHDDNDCCIAALQELIPMWKQQGFLLHSLEA